MSFRPIYEAYRRVEQACKCVSSSNECQLAEKYETIIRPGNPILECKPYAVEACRSAVGSFAEAYRNALDGHEPQCIDHQDLYDVVQNLDASCNSPTASTALPSGK